MTPQKKERVLALVAFLTAATLFGFVVAAATLCRGDFTAPGGM
ncbi:unnamed protein product, partial [marine sediment metagenome]